MDSNHILVSVVCLAFNHKNCIEQSLDSIIAQKTTFPYEIVVHDDMSTDGTVEIIKKYEKEYPDLIKPIYESENQYSKGKNLLTDISLPHTKGKYIGVCECDDYWIDDEKLQKQFEILEMHPELDMCACRAVEVSGYDGIELQEIRPKQKDSVLTVEEVILGGGMYLATASLFFRKSIFSSLMEFEKVMFFDYTEQIKGALRGGIYYLDRRMAVYRRGTEGSWSMEIEKDAGKRAKHIEKEVDMLHELDKETSGIFHTTIEQRITAYAPFEQLMTHKGDIKAEIARIQKTTCMMYVWGLGIRGKTFQEFCKNENIQISGVCDKRNINVGKLTEYGYPIYRTDFVLNNSDVIFASNDIIYNALTESGYLGRLINLQKYIPLA